MPPKKITRETITITTRIAKPTHLSKRELRKKIKNIAYHVAMLGAPGLEYCNRTFGHPNPDPDEEFIEIVVPINKITLKMRPNNKILPFITEDSDLEGKESEEDIEVPQKSTQAPKKKAVGKSNRSVDPLSVEDDDDDDDVEETPKATRTSSRKAAIPKATVPKVAATKATASKVAAPPDSPEPTPQSVKKVSTKPTIKLTFKSKGKSTVETTAPTLSASPTLDDTTSSMQINPASLHAAGKIGQPEAPVLPGMNSETLEMARKGKGKAKVALPDDSDDEPVQRTRKSKRKVEEILDESDDKPIKRTRRGKRMVEVLDESEDDEPIQRTRKTKRKVALPDESEEEPVKKAREVDVAPASPVKPSGRITRNSVKTSAASSKIAASTAAVVNFPTSIKKASTRKAGSKNASPASTPVVPPSTGGTTSQTAQATQAAVASTTTASATTTTATANNMIVSNVGDYSTALPFKDRFVLNQPRPLGFLLPVNKAHTQFKFKAYTGAPVDFSIKADLDRVNKFRNQDIRRTTTKLKTYQDGRQ